MGENNDNLEHKYLRLIEEFKQNKELMEDDTKYLEELNEKSNKLFKQIKNPSEMKLDARLLADSNQISSTVFNKKYKARKLTSQKFIDILKDDSSVELIKQFFDKIKGQYYGMTFKKPPHLVEAHFKERQKPKRIKRDEEGEFYEAKSGTSRTDDETTVIINKIISVIDKNKKVEFYRLVINPDDFAKTVENIFYLAFAIKLNKAFIIYENNVVYITSTPSKNISSDHKFDFVFNLDYVEYKLIISKLCIKDSLIK